ncbi:DEAD/DEAH box helicase [Anaerolineales bacterium HSG6]|nr:DEAD/DEAH box helicase [Anaerolineales bacterium HSG6]
MYLLHAHWQHPKTPTESGRLIFWAEDGLVEQAKGQRRVKKARPHPFAVPSSELLPLLTGLDQAAGTETSITMLLPTTKHGPLPAPQLSHAWQLDDPKPATLNLWQIPGLAVNPATALPLLIQLISPNQRPPQLVLADDCRYWQIVSQIVLETLAQQKLLPTLNRAGEEFHARWYPVLDSPTDGPRTAQLLTAMPPLCRAETSTPDSAPTPRRLYDSFLNQMTDTLVRQWAHGTRSKSLSTSEVSHSWVKGLFNRKSPKVTGKPAPLNQLHRHYRTWLRNLHVAGDKQFRVALRLEAPAQQDKPKSKDWVLHFLLQAREDPSLLISAEQVWQAKGNVLRTLNRQFKRPQEKLLAALGFAGRLFSPINDGLKISKPRLVTLSNQEAFSFLRQAAPLLESSGFGVLVPPWWNKPGMRLGVRLKMSSSNSMKNENVNEGRLSFKELVSYRWQMSVNGAEITQKDFEALVALKSPLVQIRGQWVQLDSEQIETAIDFWKQYGDSQQEATMFEAVRMGLGGETDLNGLPVEEVTATGWLKEWLKKLSGDEKLTELTQPKALQATLRPYQQYGFSWMHFLRQSGLGACLADDMGLGKTIQTISLLQRDKQDGLLSGPSLLVCPTSVVANWEREVEQFAPNLSTMIHQGPQRLKGKKFVTQAKSVDMVLTSYPVVRRDLDSLKQVKWYGVILDEAQNIKNPEAKQTQAIRKMPAQFRLALTGTPVENRLSELWSIMEFLNPGYLGNRKSFRNDFARPIERHHDEAVTERLKNMVSPFILRRVKTDPTVIQDLPDKVERKEYCNLSQEQATLYEAVVKDALEAINEAESIKRKGLVLGMLMKLKQICNYPGQFLHEFDKSAPQVDPQKAISRSGKLERLTEMLEEIVSVGDKTLIFSQFSEMGGFLQSYLQQQFGLPTMFLYGGTSAKKRKQMVNRFQEDDGPPIFILSLKAGGTGLNLTQANHVFHFDRWWNPAVEDQATDRAFRIGQTKNVQVHKFVCVGTLEEMIDDMISSKKALADSVVGKGEGWLTELSTTDLRELVKLKT